MYVVMKQQMNQLDHYTMQQLEFPGIVSPGLITSYKTQGTTALEAMQAASYFHARAAEQLGEQQSHASVMPMDIVHYLAK